MQSKQATLFRSWGGKKPLSDGNARQTYKGKAPVRAKHKNPPRHLATEKPTVSGVVVDLTEEKDFGFKNVEDLDKFFEDDVSEELVVDGGHETGHNSSILEAVPGFDPEAGREWIYPTNYPVRDYQFNIVQKCLFKNTLVCLPTGLGKTFIAAVVMFNFYCWYPSGKIVFMAPTKPLVTQQIEACHNIMGIPQSHLSEMTGNLPPRERAAQWLTKRVFFLTPQVMQNDISKGACPADDVRCVVFDEAHKALGNYSYCQVVKELSGRGVVFRILALSATPGNDLKAVQQVVTNLRLSHIELRSDDSVDIQPYTHQRKVELHIVPLEGEILAVKNAFLEVLSSVVGRLYKYGVVYSSNPERLTKYGLLQARESFRQAPPLNTFHPGAIEGDFATGISLFHAYDLLLLHGLRPFHHYLSHTFSSGSYPRAQQEIDRNSNLSRLLTELSKKLSAVKWSHSSMGKSPRSSHYTSPSQSTTPDVFYGHPKLKRLEEVVLRHFRERASAQSSDGTTKSETRVMIFSQYRESVQEIADLLSSHTPLVRVMSFVGHGTTGKSTSKGLTQKEQTEVVRKFRDGGYNTLVATCVGEEGLDIGEVDLIVCFDAHKSPVRLVQRMGRTGRKRSGKIIVIVAQGKEENTYRKSQSNKNSIHKAIQQNSHSLHFFPHAPRMIPRHISPQCLKMCMDIEEFKVKEKGQRSKGKGRQQRLSMGPPPLTRASKKGCLSHEELEEWSRDYSLSDRDLKACERAVEECYKPHPLLSLSYLKSQGSGARSSRRFDQNSSLNSSTVVQKYSLSLSKWVRWQTGQTQYKMVGSSSRGKLFISLLEFLDLMYSSEGLGESYDTEMAAFLHQDDILIGGPPVACLAESESVVVEKRERKRRRRIASDSSDDSDFVKEKEVKIAPEESQSPLIEIDDTTTVSDKIDNNCHGNDRSLPTASQHAIPKPPSCDNLDWLDNIEPTQVSTPLPSSSSTTSLRPPPSPASSSREFQFTLPKTPPSTRKSKTPFITPIKTPQKKSPQYISHQQHPVSEVKRTSVAEDSHLSHMESIDLFNDLSSAVLFDDFSDVVNSSKHTECRHTDYRAAEERVPVAPEDGEEIEELRESSEDELITSIPESDGEEEKEEGEKVDEEVLRSNCHSSIQGTSEDDSLIGVCGQQRRKFARPDFLLTQAPPTTPPTSSNNSSQSEGVAWSSDEDNDFLEPLSRRLKKKQGVGEKEGRRKDVASKTRPQELEELLDREAELSGDGCVSQEDTEEEERGERADEYDMEDSFINDNTVLTQVTPSQVPERVKRCAGPVNMAAVYRQSLMSPDNLFGGRERRTEGYKMILSERHKVLRHYMAKGAGKRGEGKRLFTAEERDREQRCSVSSSRSEAEEVRVQYGEEDREEIDVSQSIGEPWDWTAEEEEYNAEQDSVIVSPNLLASIGIEQTPSCYKLEVDGWYSNDERSSWSSEEFLIPS